MNPIRSALLTAKRQRRHFDEGGLARNIPSLTAAAAPASTTVSENLGEVSVPASTDTTASDAASQTAGYNTSDQNVSAVTDQTTDSSPSSSGDPSQWKTWFGYQPTQDDYNSMLKAAYGENSFGQSYDQYRGLYEAIGNRMASGAYNDDGSMSSLLTPDQVAGVTATDRIKQMTNSDDPKIAASRSLAQQALNDYFTEGQNKVLTTQTDWRGFQNGKPSPGIGFTNALAPGADQQSIYNKFYDAYKNPSLTTKLADMQAKNNAIWQDPNQTYAFKEPGTSTVNVTGTNDTQGPNVETAGITTGLSNTTGSDTTLSNEATDYITSPTVTNDPFTGIMSSNLNVSNVSPLIGDTGLQTDTNQIQTNSTDITGQDIIPYGTGLDLNNDTMGVSSNGISYSPMLTGIDTGFNSSGIYGIDPSGGLGPGGFDFNMFKRGGAIDKALRVAHRAAGGQVDLPSVPVTPNKYQDLRRRMLETPAPMNGQQEDFESRKFQYLQNNPGAQVRGPTFARGGYADGGDPPTDTAPDDNVQPGESVLMQERAALTPRNMGALIQGPEASREQQPVMDPATMGQAWDTARRNYQNFPVQEGEAIARPLELGARDVIGGSADDDIVSQALDVTRDAPPLTPAEIARRWTPPEDYGAQSPAPETMNKDLTWDKLGDALSKYPQHLIDKWTDTVKYPGDITMGNKKFNTDEAIQKSLELSQLAMTGGIGGAAARPGEAIFGSGPIRTIESNLANSTKVDPMGLYSHAAEITAPERQLNDIGLYSHAAEVSSMLPQAKGTPEQMAAMLQKQGVKPAEMEGFTEAFAGKPSVTREELAQHFNERMPQVEETVLDFNQNEVKAARERAESAGNNWDELGPVDQGRYIRSVSGRSLTDYGTDPKFQQYTLPGGENYREVLLKLPQTDVTGDQMAMKLFGAPMKEITQQQRAEVINALTTADPRFKSSHWDDPNVLAHLRLADRTGPNGEKILHVEEIQSDWGQKGKKEGFHDDAKAKDAQARVDDAMQRTMEINAQMEALTRVRDPRTNRMLDEAGWHRLARERDQARVEMEKAAREAPPGVPTAPYVTNTQAWTDLALKRALKEAAEGGYDKMVWTPGAEQAKRYSLSHQLDSLHYAPSLNGKTFTIEGYKGGENIVNKTNIPADKMAEYFGQDVAEKILNGEKDYTANTGYNVLQGQNLEVGSSGMKGYYDKIVPNQLSKLVKKLDPSAKVGMTDVLLPPKGGIGHNNPPLEAPGITITPKMREAIMKGQTAYAKGGTIPFGPEAAQRAVQIAKQQAGRR